MPSALRHLNGTPADMLEDMLATLQAAEKQAMLQ